MNWSLCTINENAYIYIYILHIISYIMICSQIQSETCKLRTSTPVRDCDRDCGGSFVPKHHPELQIGVQDTVMSRISTWHFWRLSTLKSAEILRETKPKYAQIMASWHADWEKPWVNHGKELCFSSRIFFSHQLVAW